MKIVFFIGRHHHALKLSNVMNALRQREHEVVTIVSTNSVNIDPSSEFVWRYDPNYRHVYDYLDSDSIRHIDMGAGDLFSFFVREELTKSIAPFWTTHSIREANECIVGFANMLNVEKPDAVFVLHSNNFFARILLYLARQHGIRTYATQEGLLRHRDQKTQNKQLSSADYVDRLFTWSDSDRQSYLDAGVESDRIVPVGPFHLDQYVQAKRSDQFVAYQAGFKHSIGIDHNRSLVSFMPPVASRYEGDFVRALTELSRFCSENNVQLAIRLHPFDYGLLPQIKSLLSPYHVTFYEQDDSVALVAFSDVIISQQSTTMIEALYLDTKRIEIDLDRIGVLESFAKRKLATLIETNRFERIFDVLKTNEDTNEVIEWKRTNGSLVDGQSTMRIVQYMENEWKR